MSHIIFHIDVNSAYLSWSSVENLKQGSALDLRTVPAIIGGDRKSRHGIVLAKSIPAKKYGIYTSEPIVSALKKCPDLIIEPPDHRLYHQYSKGLMDYLHTLTPDIEQVSVDECYLDFTPIAHRYASYMEAAAMIRKYIRETFGYTVNIGISSKKVLAKMASDFTKPDKTHTLFPSEIREKMWPLSVDELFMVGRSSAARLHSMGIHTIGQLACTSRMQLVSIFKSHGALMWDYANGIDDTAVQPQERKAQGIGNSTTLAKDADTMEDISRVLLGLSEKVAERLKNAHQLAGTVTVEIKYHTFQSVSRQMPLLTPSSSSQELYQAAVSLARALWNNEPVRLLGIRTTHLIDETEPVQMSIFNMAFPAPDHAKKEFSAPATEKKDPSAPESEKRNPSAPLTACSDLSRHTEKQENAESSAASANSNSASSKINESASEKRRKLDAALHDIRKRYGDDAVIRASLMPKKD